MGLFNTNIGDKTDANTSVKNRELFKDVNISPQFWNPAVIDDKLTPEEMKNRVQDEILFSIYEGEYGSNEVIRFNDRSYFGSQDYIPIDIVKDIVTTSAKLDVNPLLPLTTAAAESRFWQSEFKNESDDDRRDEFSMMRLLGNIQRESGTDVLNFEGWVLNKGLINNESEVIKNNYGYFLSDDFYNNTSYERFVELEKQYEEYVNEKTKELDSVNYLPFHTSIGYLKRKGIVDYNPYELKGNKTKEEGGFTYTKDRTDRFEDIYNILKEEKRFNEVVDSLLNVTGNENTLNDYQKMFEDFLKSEKKKTITRKETLGLSN